MKVEIEYREIEILKGKIEKQKTEIEYLQNKLNQFDEKMINHKIKEKSYDLLNKYLIKLYKDLGLAPRYKTRSIEFNDDLCHWLGDEWYKSERAKMAFVLILREDFKSALLEISVLRENK